MSTCGNNLCGTGPSGTGLQIFHGMHYRWRSHTVYETFRRPGRCNVQQGKSHAAYCSIFNESADASQLASVNAGLLSLVCLPLQDPAWSVLVVCWEQTRDRGSTYTAVDDGPYPIFLLKFWLSYSCFPDGLVCVVLVGSLLSMQ